MAPFAPKSITATTTSSVRMPTSAHAYRRPSTICPPSPAARRAAAPAARDAAGSHAMSRNPMAKQAASPAKAQPVPKAVTTRPAATGPMTRVADVVTFRSGLRDWSRWSARTDGGPRRPRTGGQARDEQETERKASPVARKSPARAEGCDDPAGRNGSDYQGRRRCDGQERVGGLELVVGDDRRQDRLPRGHEER